MSKFDSDTIMLTLVTVIGMLESDNEYVRLKADNCTLIYRSDNIMFTLKNMRGMSLHAYLGECDRNVGIEWQLIGDV